MTSSPLAAVLAAAAALLAVCAAGRPAAPPAAWKLDERLLTPFWRTSAMRGESVLFVREGASGPPSAPLVFAPTRILSVVSTSGLVTYEAGRDYVWDADRGRLTLPEGSRIPCASPAQLRRKHGTQMFNLTHRDGGDEILFGASTEYLDMQVTVTYDHRRSPWPAPRLAGSLPKALERLRQRRPLAVALLGDSISTGCNCSGWANVPPHQPPWQEIVRLALERRCRAAVTLTNLAVGGTDTSWGLGEIGKVADAQPDLVILAFGMNDAAGREAPDYAANIRKMVEAVRARRPEAEFILVAPMLGNPDWTALRHDRFPQYRDALAGLCAPGIALADV
ncbi:MAG: SGNH/GDSL hydrolase family protein, partial [Armatimonadetes bacterium]|nr:SGNH/GDSL hydrolase family protein [Armatimonadota bacterium]